MSESNNEIFNEMLSSDKTTEINTGISDETTETSKRKYYYFGDPDISDEEIESWINAAVTDAKTQGMNDEDIERLSHAFDYEIYEKYMEDMENHIAVSIEESTENNDDFLQ